MRMSTAASKLFLIFFVAIGPALVLRMELSDSPPCQMH